MAYAALSDVQALLPKWVYDGTSKPTSTQVTTIINQISAQIDSILRSLGHAVPVTTPSDFLDYLKQTNAIGAAALIVAGQFPAESGAASTSLGEQLQKNYEGRLQELKDGSVIPPDLAKAGTRVKAETYLTKNPDEEVDLGDIAEPWFKREKTF